jgi:hypothetical protein
MRIWNLAPGDPLHLTLSADFRLGGEGYLNDHTWELELGNGDPPALSLRTTYGLRARAMRLFPRFSEGRSAVADPAKFTTAPRLTQFFPNFLELQFVPLPDLDVTAEIWIPTSQSAAGRLTLVNRAPAARKIRFEMCAALIPLDGQTFAPAQIQMVNVLTARTGGLAPLLFLTGGPDSGAGTYPSLFVDLDLAPGASRQLTWVQVALATHEASYELARRLAARPWDAERARIEMVNEADTLDIQTGDLDWDAALALTQKAAFSLFLPASDKLPNPSFVLTRGPDNGHTHKGDGSDYPLAWAGQSPLEALYLAGQIPGAPKFARGLLENFLAAQSDDGSIDLRPGLAGQRGNMLAAPLLASLAWEIYLSNKDETFLKESFPGLIKFFWAWFSLTHDRDRDGLPEWDHLLQTGWEDNPLFDTWNPWSQGVDVSTVNNPGLYSMLAREAGCLILMAEKIGRSNDVELVRHQAELLEKAVQANWDEDSALYQYRDLTTRLCSEGKVIARGKGGRPLKPKAEFASPVRLLIEIQTKSPAVKRPEARIAEQATKEAVETIPASQFKWRSGGMAATSQGVYERVGRVEVLGLDAGDKVIVKTVDLTQQDHTLFLPLWAGLPDPERAQTLVRRALLDKSRFRFAFGIPACAQISKKEAEPSAMSVHLPWNHLIGEGLLEYGFRDEAARLTEGLMSGVIRNLKQSRAFNARHHAKTGAGLGERNALAGLAPLSLFLQTLGVTILSATRVRLEGSNPFPWSVTIRYRGLTVKRGADSTEIIFPNGKSVTVTQVEPCEVAM